MIYYKCTKDLWSLYIPNLLKFNKDGVYECIGNNAYINNQGISDYIAIEGWQEYFVPIDLNDISLDEVNEILQTEPNLIEL